MPFACPDPARKYLSTTVFARTPSPHRRKILALLCALHVGAAGAQAPAIRDVDVRSFLGDPLNVRISVDASLDREAPNCHSVIDRSAGMLQSRDLQLTMVELRASRYLMVRSRTAINEPVVSFALRMGCPGEPMIEREFTLLLDPPPFTVAPTTEASAASASPTTGSLPAATVPAAGVWTVVSGDTLQSIARGIHPKNRVRQRQYMQAMRDLNPELAKFAGDAPLVEGSALRTPDLKTLSGILPAPSAAPAVVPTPRAAQDSAVPQSPAQPKAPADSRAAPRATPPVPAAKPVAPTLKQPLTPPVAPSAPPPSAPAANKPVPEKFAEPSSGFRLRLSSAEIDLGRSRNVTEEQRTQLRDKQLMLDADDQIAALLSLRNTVKVLETRLNEMQLKMATVPSASLPTANPPAAAEPTPKPSPALTPPAAPATDERRAATVAAEPPTEKPAPTVTSPPPRPAPAPAIAPEGGFTSLLPPWMMAGGAALLALLLAAAWWAKRGASARARGDRSATDEAGNPLMSPPVTQMGPTKSETEFAEWAEDKKKAAAEKVAPRQRAAVAEPVTVVGDEAAPVTSAQAASPHDIRYAPPAKAESVDDHQATVRIDKPVVFDDTPARYELDSTPATTVDFPLGLDDKPPEDRVRRLQYMHERYPELKSNTVSIDDADSVINASRLYYDEGDNRGGGRDKACELLTFAVEERPQEIRFWLAQFEIFRLENMIAEFGALASKFQMLFSHTPAWPKVRHIGHEIDPGNPLYAESGRPSLGGDTRFDPIAENWLNAPMDFTSDALMSDLRRALLDDHNVTRAEFDNAAAKLTASAR